MYPLPKIRFPTLQPYRLGFTAGALGIAQCRTLAALRRRLGSWDAVRDEVLTQNRLQQARRSSLLRTEREFRQRLGTLTERQLALTEEAGIDIARLVALLAAFKLYAFLFDFSILCLRPKVVRLDLALRPSDYENFLAEVEPSHPELTTLALSSRAKLRQVSLRIFAEGGLLSETRNPTIVRPALPPAFVRCVLEDVPAYLAGFLVPDSDIKQLAGSSGLAHTAA